MDFARIQQIYNNAMRNSTQGAAELISKLEPLPQDCFDSTVGGGKETPHQLADKIRGWEGKGFELIGAGKVRQTDSGMALCRPD